MARKSHSHAGDDQEHSKCRSRDCRGRVASEGIRSFPLRFPIPCRSLICRGTAVHPDLTRERKTTRQYGSLLTPGDILKHVHLLVIGSILSLSAFARSERPRACGE